MNGSARFFSTVGRHVTNSNNNNIGIGINTLSAITRAYSKRSASSLSTISGNGSSCSLGGAGAARSILGGGGGSGCGSITTPDSFVRSQTVTNTTTSSGGGGGDEQRRHRSNRSRRGLYDGKDIRTGNNLSFSMKHTKRTFKPNVFVKRVYSEILDEMVKFHLTTSTLRSIDKSGGLDNYLLTSRHIGSGEGLQTKKRIVQALKYRERKGRRPDDQTEQA